MMRYAGSAAAEVVSHWPEVVAAAEPAGGGPGAGLGRRTRARHRRNSRIDALTFALNTDLPVIVDADALTMLAAHPHLVADRDAPTVLTPHAGEFARLAGLCRRGEDRVAATRRLADAFGATVLLKGNVTVIADPGGPGVPQSRRRVVGGDRRVRRRAVRHDRRAAGRRTAAGRGRRRRGVRARPRRQRLGRRPRPRAGPHVGVAHPRPHPFQPLAALVARRKSMPHVKYRSPSIAPAYTGRLSTDPIPSLRLPDESMEPAAAYRFIHDELMLDGSSRLNLATFVTTWMDPEAEKLMAETFDKNMIDKDEYPATAAIESRCVSMVADLFHAEDLRDDDAVQRDRGVDDRVVGGGDAGRAGAEVAVEGTGRPARTRMAGSPARPTW